MEKKLIIFDMDGVLFDSIGFAQQAFMDRHPGVSEEMYKEIHSGNFYEGASKYVHLQITETEAEKKKRAQDYMESKSKTPMFPGIKDLLEELLRLGHVLVLNTNAYGYNCLPLLEYSGIKPMFDMIATADLSRNKTEKFMLIEAKYGLGKKDILFITDALGDVREAGLAGIPTIAVTWGVHDRSYFVREPHDNLIGIVDTVAEIKDYI